MRGFNSLWVGFILSKGTVLITNRSSTLMN